MHPNLKLSAEERLRIRLENAGYALEAEEGAFDQWAAIRVATGRVHTRGNLEELDSWWVRRVKGKLQVSCA